MKFIIRFRKEIEKYMIEYLNALCNCGINELEYDNEYSELDELDKKTIIELQLPNNSQNKHIYINTEQFTRKEFITKLILNLKNNKIEQIFHIDYSLSNISIIKNNLEIINNHKIKLYYFPYSYSEKEISLLKSIILRNTIPTGEKTSKKIYDIGIISVNNKRRQDICERLKELNIKVLIINGTYGIKRDNLMENCKILLNIHYSDNYQVFEELRCMRWWFAGIPIISENSIFMEDLDVFSYIIWSSYNNICHTVIDTLEKYNNNTLLIQSEEEISKIALSRKNILEENINNLYNDYNRQLIN
jgi:hypothetical protein